MSYSPPALTCAITAPVDMDTQLFVSSASGGQTYTARCLVSPARQWNVYVMPHSHVDVGYTNVQTKVLALHMNNIDEAIRIAERSAAYPPEARFKWSTDLLERSIRAAKGVVLAILPLLYRLYVKGKQNT